MTLKTQLRIELDPYAMPPLRGHNTDAGLDLRSPVNCFIPAGGAGLIDTGVHVQLPAGCCGLLVSKSGLNVRADLTSTGLIDEGYTGSIKVKLYNHGYTDYQIKVGDKITQLVILPCVYPEIMIVPRIDGGERGDQGFGSTGR